MDLVVLKSGHVLRLRTDGRLELQVRGWPGCSGCCGWEDSRMRAFLFISAPQWAATHWPAMTPTPLRRHTAAAARWAAPQLR